MNQWLVYEQGSHVAISTDWLLCLAAVASTIAVMWAAPRLWRLIWR